MGEDFMSNLGMGLTTATAYGILGILLTLAGYKLFSLVAGFNLKDEIANDQNVAAGLVVSAVILGTAIIVGTAIT